MSTDDRELEVLLRRALAEHAEKVVPVGDGLAKIQQRAANRRRRMVWLRPGIAVAAAAIAAVAAIAIPTAIHRMDNGNSGTDAGGQPTASAISGSASKSAKQSPTPKKQTQVANRLAPVAMTWPYSSAKVAARSDDPALQNPDELATTFVASFAGADSSKSLVGTAQNPQGGAVTVEVKRGTMLVSRVQLAKVGGTKASYVVTAANGTNVSLDKSALTRTTNSITVSGAFVPDNQAVSIWAGAGTTYDTSKATPITATTDNVDTAWQLQLNARNASGASGPKILAAWTVDNGGQVLDFSAIAAN